MRKEDRITESLAIAKALVCSPSLKKPIFLTSTAGTSLECNIQRRRSTSEKEGESTSDAHKPQGEWAGVRWFRLLT
jgi:hypothetical protein